jgi:hypothetical protein
VGKKRIDSIRNLWFAVFCLIACWGSGFVMGISRHGFLVCVAGLLLIAAGLVMGSMAVGADKFRDKRIEEGDSESDDG